MRPRHLHRPAHTGLISVWISCVCERDWIHEHRGSIRMTREWEGKKKSTTHYTCQTEHKPCITRRKQCRTKHKPWQLRKAEDNTRLILCAQYLNSPNPAREREMTSIHTQLPSIAISISRSPIQCVNKPHCIRTLTPMRQQAVPGRYLPELRCASSHRATLLYTVREDPLGKPC